MSGASYVAIRIQGGLLPADLLSRLGVGRDLDGLTSADYHLAAGESVREAANRVWAYLRGVWSSYREALSRLSDTDRATTLTRERWSLILLDQLGYGRVPLTGAGGLSADGKAFAVSHVWQSVPIHLLGARVDLDRRTQGVAGAAGASPQSLVQELLNHTDAHLWAVLSNGGTLRLLRDSTSLVGSAYVEFDLEAIFDGDLFADFLLLYTLCHQSRVEVRDAEVGPTSVWLEAWRQTALESGTRALAQLRDGVVAALQTLGTGFLSHPENRTLREQVDGGTWSIEDIHHALLRVVYRLLFTFVAEDRGALLDPAADPSARARYAEYFSTDRLRVVARRRTGGRQGDRWRSLCLVWDGLASPTGRPELGIMGIGGLFEAGPLDVLATCQLSNEALLSAVRSLSLVREPKSGFRRVVDHRNLGAEELGSIYESLLEYVPRWDQATSAYSLVSAAGNARKTSGSYYTPTSLIDCLLDSALDPVLDDAQKNASDPEAALLAVTVCDPACGSGHFLVGAARRIAKRVAEIRTGDPEPAPEAVRSALREVVSRCIYGVDINPLAAELAKVSLWLEALEPGRPLAFLDAQIKVGNALVGATPALLADGVPDVAFKPIEGDSKVVAAALGKQNKRERSGQDTLFEATAADGADRLAAEARRLVGAPGLSLADVHVQQQRLQAYVDSPTYRQAREVADAWCAAFVWPKTEQAPRAVTHQVLTDLVEEPERVPTGTRDEVARLAAEYRFFHWHLEFPHVFSRSGEPDELNPVTGWRGGFDVLLANPPWEHVELKEQEYFDSRDPEIAQLSGARRKSAITQLVFSGSALAVAYTSAKRQLDGLRHFAAESGRYPLCGRGRIKTDTIFAEGSRTLLDGRGRFGMILPTGIATDATTQYFFKDLVLSRSLASLYDFENSKPLFEGVHRSFKFSLLTLTGRANQEPAAEFAFFAHDPSDLQRPSVRFELTPEEITLLNPNTGTCPVFRSRRDAEITLGIYRRVPVLINENDPVNGNPWGIKFMQGLFNMTSDSHLFHTRDELEAEGWTLQGNIFKRGDAEMLPLYEGKMGHLYNPHAASFVGTGDTDIIPLASPAIDRVALPRYWVGQQLFHARLGRRDWATTAGLLGFRRVTRNTDERTIIATMLPLAPASYGWILSAGPSARALSLLNAQYNSFAMDFLLRQFLSQPSIPQSTFEQLAIIPPDVMMSGDVIPGVDDEWFIARVSALYRTIDGLAGWRRELSLRTQGNKECIHGQLLRAELDAACFIYFGYSKDDAEYVMETFPIVKRKDLAAHGEYRTKRMILEAYDAMAESIRTGVPYERG